MPVSPGVYPGGEGVESYRYSKLKSLAEAAIYHLTIDKTLLQLICNSLAGKWVGKYLQDVISDVNGPRSARAGLLGV